jgi:galactoside O-acetyltransferase
MFLTEEQLSQVGFKRHSVVGAGSVCLPGCYLEEGAAIGAMSLVKGFIPPFTIYAGNPLRLIRKRSRELKNLETQHKNGM